MSFENSKRPNESIELNGDSTFAQRKRIRRDDNENRQLKRRLSPSPNGQQNKIQHITNGASRPPIIPLMPSQRLELFKRRQKWRQTNFYNSRNYLAKSGTTSLRSSREPSAEVGSFLSNSTRNAPATYVEASTQTDTIPSLQSKNVERLKAKPDLKSNVGIFSGEILYDSDELDEGKNKSPVKFPESKIDNNRALPVSSGTLSALLNEKKKITQTEKPKDIPVEKPIEKKTSINPEPKEASVGPSSGFNFLGSKTTRLEELEQDNDEPVSSAKPALTNDKPIPSFSFEAKKEEKEAESPVANSTFAFGNKITDIKETSTPAFSFSSNKDTSKPAFSFGGKPNVEKSESSGPSLFGSKPETSKPSGFSFGSKPTEDVKEKPTPAFSFGANGGDKETVTSSSGTEQAKPAFSFGATSGDKPSFSFGSKPATESETKAKEEGPKPTFSFGNTSQEKEKSAPAFSFGTSKVESNEINGSKPTFSFGTKTEDSKDTKDKPSFNFGGKSDDSAKPSFNFETKPSESTEKPAFSFGAKPAEKSDAAKPAFSFGASSTSNTLFGASTANKEETKEDQPRPFSLENSEEPDDGPRKKRTAFNLGSGDTKPTINFGSSTSAPAEKPANGSLFGDATKPAGFNFGASSENKSETEKKPTFSFGQTAKPSFSFGAPSTTQPASSTPVTEKPSFSFGNAATTTQDNKPSFGFGNNATGSTAAKPLGFNFGADATKTTSGFGASTETKPSTNFSFGAGGATPTPASVFGQASGAQASSTPFNFGTTTQPAFGNNTQQPNTNSAFGSAANAFGNNTPAAKPSFASGSSVNFNFANNNGNPAAVFGGQQQSTPFGAPQAPSTGFGFGAAQPPAFGGATNTPFGGAAPGATPFGSPAPGTPTQVAPQSRVPGRRIAQMRQRRR